MYHETTPIGYWLAIVMIATGAATHIPMVAAVMAKSGAFSSRAIFYG